MFEFVGVRLSIEVEVARQAIERGAFRHVCDIGDEMLESRKELGARVDLRLGDVERESLVDTELLGNEGQTPVSQHHAWNSMP